MKRIIVADDEEILRNMFGNLIKRRGRAKGVNIDVTLVSSGEELVERVLNENYGLIISDYDMRRDMTGIDALRAIRKSGIETPFFVISSSGVEDEAMREGATGYLDKPYDIVKFKEIINNYLEERENE